MASNRLNLGELEEMKFLISKSSSKPTMFQASPIQGQFPIVTYFEALVLMKWSQFWGQVQILPTLYPAQFVVKWSRFAGCPPMIFDLWPVNFAALSSKSLDESILKELLKAYWSDCLLAYWDVFQLCTGKSRLLKSLGTWLGAVLLSRPNFPFSPSRISLGTDLHLKKWNWPMSLGFFSFKGKNKMCIFKMSLTRGCEVADGGPSWNRLCCGNLHL